MCHGDYRSVGDWLLWLVITLFQYVFKCKFAIILYTIQFPYLLSMGFSSLQDWVNLQVVTLGSTCRPQFIHSIHLSINVIQYTHSAVTFFCHADRRVLLNAAQAFMDLRTFFFSIISHAYKF